MPYFYVNAPHEECSDCVGCGAAQRAGREQVANLLDFIRKFKIENMFEEFDLSLHSFH